MKITSEQIKESEKLYQELVEKAWEDASFKQQLLNNPEEAIGELTGTNFVLPEGRKIVVEDQTDTNTIYVNIPVKMDADSIELTEDQLEAVSGGIAPLVVYGAIFLGGVAIAAIKERRG